MQIESGSGGVTLDSIGCRDPIDTGSGGIDTEIPIQVKKAERSYLRDNRGRKRRDQHETDRAASG